MESSKYKDTKFVKLREEYFDILETMDSKAEHEFLQKHYIDKNSNEDIRELATCIAILGWKRVFLSFNSRFFDHISEIEEHRRQHPELVTKCSAFADYMIAHIDKLSNATVMGGFRNMNNNQNNSIKRHLKFASRTLEEILASTEGHSQIELTNSFSRALRDEEAWTFVFAPPNILGYLSADINGLDTHANLNYNFQRFDPVRQTEAGYVLPEFFEPNQTLS